MPQQPVLWNLDERGVATVTLNRPHVNNAYDGDLIQGLLAAMDDLGRKSSLRIVVLKGNGRHFQAGADLKWIDAVRGQSPAENEAVSRATAEAVDRLNRLPVPVVALGQVLENDPKAIAETKATILENAAGGFDAVTFENLVKSHAAKRQTREAAEGLASFAEKRSARW